MRWLLYAIPSIKTHSRTTATRLIIELIEELVLLGGGYGLFDGCAAGDTAAAIVVKVDVK